MKHIFKKLHFGSGGSHESSSSSSGRSSEVSTAGSPLPSSTDPSSATALTLTPMAAAGSSITSGTATHQRSPSIVLPPQSTSPSALSPADTAAADSVAAIRARMVAADYFSSEEDYQMQLAMAISASNSELLEDPHNDQIRAATLLSLGRHRDNRTREIDASAESLSRRYWDYNVLNYDEKIVDGFYDIFVLSSDSMDHGKMPSLSDLQANIGDLGFEVIIVNRAIDPALQELEQVAQCISLDCQNAEVSILVQRIADVVTAHMGGPVRDANDMLARWMEKSTTLRTSLQTSLLPIGGVNVGLSRHRALLFKVLADKVGIPCKLVKGSHYTGIDDDAVNIIKVDNDREFLVDLMAAPGILIPADVLSTKDSFKSSSDKSSSGSKDDLGSVSFCIESSTDYTGGGKAAEENNGVLERVPKLENVVLPSIPSSSNGSVPSSNVVLPSIPSSSNGSVPSSSGSCFDEDKRSSFPDHHNQPMLTSNVTISNVTIMHKEDPGMPINIDDMKEKPAVSGNMGDSKDLFAELNPFHTKAGKVSLQSRVTDQRINGSQRRRENISPGPGRPPLPLVWKNRSPCNEVSSNKTGDLSQGFFPPKKIYPENSKIRVGHNIPGTSYSPGVGAPRTELNGSPVGNFACYSTGSEDTRLASSTNQYANPESEGESVRPDGHSMSSLAQPSEDKCQGSDGTSIATSQITMTLEHGKNVNNKPERRKYSHERFMGTSMILRDGDQTGASTQSWPDRLDPMLDDVAELEIPWEDLIIGERIGLGSYGEVYHADWNGTEVAVKKFLNQDFYGDALDEFRSEVRIMRRLRHPNVVLFMGAVTRPPNLSIVTEFLPRGSLYRLLHRPNCQIDEKRRIKMALDVAKGMNCLHTSIPTIVHRDLKSPNLLVDKNWNVKVSDFGLSRLKHNTFLSSKSTAGTPEWMAPEVLRNEQSNEKCDVYSFGVILWELATLRMPWSGMNAMQVVGAVGFQNRRLDIPQELDPLVSGIIWKCWQTDPSLRPSFAELTSALKPLQRLVIPFHEDTHELSIPTEISVNSTP